MPGESILVIDESQAVQEIAQTTLSAAGYDVTTAGNGAAALALPGIQDIDLIVMGSDLEGLDGEETTRILKQHGETHPIPVLLLVPESRVPERESMTLPGACGFVLKPFDSALLLQKVDQIFDQANLDELARQYLSDTADRLMTELADKQITQAIERKTQLIIERCIQKVTMAVDQRARDEVEGRVTALATEKEQELVKLTVREVANSMVEKLAATKVNEAMEAILEEQTDRNVRRVADSMIPNLVREKIKEISANIMPREVENRLQKAAENMIPEISEQLVNTVVDASGKTVPRMARELLPPVVEDQVRVALDKTLPRQVADLVSRELSTQLAEKIQPSVREASKKLRRTILIWSFLLGVILATGLGGLYWFMFFYAPNLG